MRLKYPLPFNLYIYSSEDTTNEIKFHVTEHEFTCKQTHFELYDT